MIGFPAHIGLFPDVTAIETEGVTEVFTDMVRALEVDVWVEPEVKIILGRIDEVAVPLACVQAPAPAVPSAR